MKTCAIIIAAYDCPEFILACVESVKKQINIPGWQYDIRIGVDGCKKTADILRKNKVPFYWSPKNHGAYIIRNSLIYLKPADVYSYFDADDVMLQGYIGKQIIETERGADGILLPKMQVDQNMKTIKKEPIIESGGAMAFTHEVLEALGGYYRYRCAGDTDFMERMRMHGFLIVECLQPPYYLRRRHNKSLTKSGLTRYRSEYRLKSWAEMTKKREQGIIKIKPTTVELESM